MSEMVVLSLLASLLLLPLSGQQTPVQNPTTTLPPKPITSVGRQENRPPVVEKDDVVRITTNLVQIDAVVTKDDKQITDLRAEDFEIFEDGKPQTISNFSYIRSVPKTSVLSDSLNASVSRKNKEAAPVLPPRPRADTEHRTIAVVVDDLGISFESIGQIRKQLRKFIEEEILSDDLVAIIRTGGEVGALQQFTTDKRLLLRAVENLRWSHCSRMGISALPSVGLESTVGLCSDPQAPLVGTLDALRFILQGMRTMPGRKSMIILSENLPVDYPEDSLPRGPIRRVLPAEDSASSESPGEPSDSPFGNEAALRRVAEMAIRASVVIYGADTTGLQPLGPTAADNNPVNLRPTGTQPFDLQSSRRHLLQDNRTGLDLLTQKTGGFLVKNSNNFKLRRIMQDQEGYYLIGYRPTEETFNRRFHSIRVRVKRPGLRVRSRSGFFGMTDEDVLTPQLTDRDLVNIALMSPFGASEIEVHLTALFANLPLSGSLIRSLIHFPGAALTFVEEPGGWHKSRINLSCIVFGDNGRVVKQVNETRQLRLQNEEFNQVLRDGLVYQFDVPVKTAGGYQFRVAVRDEDSARIGTAREFIDVPDMKQHRLVLSGITVSDFDKPKTNVSLYSSPSVRRFVAGSNLVFGYVVYNAQLNIATHLPDLTAQSKIFREGKLVYASEPKAIAIAGQNDMERITASGGVELGSGLEPGAYILQINVNDGLAKEKYRSATQWIDFEIMKQ